MWIVENCVFQDVQVSTAEINEEEFRLFQTDVSFCFFRTFSRGAP